MASKRWTVAFALVAVAGCKRSPPVQPVADVTCDQVGGSLAQALADDLAKSPDADKDAATINRAVVQAVVESCTVDTWSAAARACFVEAHAEGADKCRNEINDAQALALNDRIDSAVAKVAPADCTELASAVSQSLNDAVEQAPADQRAKLSAQIPPFVTAVSDLCAAGWSAEVRTCIRDAARAGLEPERCARWMDEAQRNAYRDATISAFGPPPEPR